ncbi:ADP-ribosylglycohydrolase [Natronospira proteinivora]|uniref:ADP-ribosylglycohydrolase n=1 Tax=Natronospira proteinivora TaxID=1807133 RepID=A0ABT1G8K5_9GAMM|nr:ADP-ribosylglycohydrolase family protein [Natronospira proteinivora]MCP1727637.1 ADP-ribosylglycohydrolase [Natronospira proteinivora]
MLGAIAGDIIGSPHEFNNIRHTEFELFPAAADFTDDTVLTVAVAEAILEGRAFNRSLQGWYMRFPHCSYGGSFHNWARSGGSAPYNSWGNGSAMRVSPAGWAAADEMEALALAEQSAAVTHNHPEGIKGAQAVALAIFLARQGESQARIQNAIEDVCEYQLDHDLTELRAHYTFDVSCQGSVPQAIACFLQSEDFEDAIRKAVSIGGDSDTIAAIVGAIAEAYFDGVPESIAQASWARLPDTMRSVIRSFHAQYPGPTRIPEGMSARQDFMPGR